MLPSEWSRLSRWRSFTDEGDRLIPFRSSLSVSITELPGAHAVVVSGMGHAFDPAGHEAIRGAVDWVLGEKMEVQPSSGA
jgi:hypothetical protein